jgi:hypothetical protein
VRDRGFAIRIRTEELRKPGGVASPYRRGAAFRFHNIPGVTGPARETPRDSQYAAPKKCGATLGVSTSSVSARRGFQGVASIPALSWLRIFSPPSPGRTRTPTATPLRLGWRHRWVSLHLVPVLLRERRKSLNPHRHYRPSSETKTSLNSVVPNRTSAAPGSTSMRPALCATYKSKTNRA